MREIRKFLEVETERLAFEWLEDEKVRLQSHTGSGPIPKQLFDDFVGVLAGEKDPDEGYS